MKDLGRQFDNLWGDLATYNAERCRGLVHTPEWDQYMAEKQAVYNKIQAEGGDLWNPKRAIPIAPGIVRIYA